MPILRKNGQALYFAHIPKNAGSSLYSLFLSNGWHLSNFGRPQGPLGTTGTAQEIRENYGITDLQKEGNFSKVQTSLQHVTADIWSEWGSCDYSFALVRNPYSRFVSAYTYRYLTSISASNAQHSDTILEEFQALIMPFFEKDLPSQPHAFDNHFRPQLDFITPDTRLYLIEYDGMQDLASDLGLKGDMPHKKHSEFHIELNEQEKAFFNRHYAGDIAWYEEIISSMK